MQIEIVDFDKTFALLVSFKSFRFLLISTFYFDKKLLEMDIKSTFLIELLNEEVYIEQPKGFVELHYPDYLFKLSKELYGLKQAPRAWYLSQF